MSPTAEFHMADTRSSNHSGESIMTDSDLEHFGAEERSPGDTSRYYWLGTRIFEDILARVVFNESALSSTVQDLDVSLPCPKHHQGSALIVSSPP